MWKEMPDRFEGMSVLLVVVETGSLSAASRRLGMPLATVSRKVSELEAHLETRLFNRSGRGLSLTDAGQGYVAACRRILEDLSEAEQAVSGEYSVPRGHLVITAPIVFGRLHVLPIIVQFLKAYPEIDIRLLLFDRVVNLPEEHVDLAIRIGELPDSSLVARRVGEIRRVLCGSPDYFARHGHPERLENLRSHDCITFENLMSPAAWTFKVGKSDKTIPIHSRLVVNTAEAAIQAAIAGLGLTRVLSYQIAEAVASGQLILALEAFEPAPWPVHLVYKSQGPVPQKLRAFLDFAGPRLKVVLRCS
jgi:DNA-binding transcriptional LysR family regulator